MAIKEGPDQDDAPADAPAPSLPGPNGNEELNEEEEEADAAAADDDENSVNAVAAAAAPTNKRPREVEKEAKDAPPLRRGKWSLEEEAYASRLIVEFKAGLLPLTDGTTLRTFLSKLLNCDPMRISKKFVGSNCIGKQVFRRKSSNVSKLTPEQIQRTRKELSELERKFLDRVTKGGSSGGRKGEKAERVGKKMKLADGQGMPSSLAGGLAGSLAPNSSAAAAGHALLGGGAGAPGLDSTGLLAKLQASQPGMFNTNDTKLFNAAAAGNAGLNIPGMANPANGMFAKPYLNHSFGSFYATNNELVQTQPQLLATQINQHLTSTLSCSRLA